MKDNDCHAQPAGSSHCSSTIENGSIEYFFIQSCSSSDVFKFARLFFDERDEKTVRRRRRRREVLFARIFSWVMLSLIDAGTTSDSATSERTIMGSSVCCSISKEASAWSTDSLIRCETSLSSAEELSGLNCSCTMSTGTLDSSIFTVLAGCSSCVSGRGVIVAGIESGSALRSIRLPKKRNDD